MNVKKPRRLSRRDFLSAVAGAAVVLPNLLAATPASAQGSAPGLPLPDELVDATLKRLFGQRTLQRGEDKIKFDAPPIAEDGGNVGVTIESSLPLGGAAGVSRIYIISDRNRRPLLAKFSFTPDSGRAYVSTAVRLATSTDMRAIVETGDGALYSVTKHVRVTVSGCDLPPQS